MLIFWKSIQNCMFTSILVKQMLNINVDWSARLGAGMILLANYMQDILGNMITVANISGFQIFGWLTKDFLQLKIFSLWKWFSIYW